jgi:hypothetical protein
MGVRGATRAERRRNRPAKVVPFVADESVMSAMRRLLLVLVGMGTLAAPRSQATSIETRPLRVLLVVSGEASPVHLAMARGFGAAVQDVLAEGGLTGAAVCIEDATPSHAAKEFSARRCDAIVVLGADRPRALRKLAARTLVGDLGRAFCYDSISLLLLEGNVAMEERFAAAFASALKRVQTQPRLLAGN